MLFKALYGIQCLPEHDPNIELSEHVCDLTFEAMRPGRWFVDSMPFCEYNAGSCCVLLTLALQ